MYRGWSSTICDSQKAEAGAPRAAMRAVSCSMLEHATWKRPSGSGFTTWSWLNAAAASVASAARAILAARLGGVEFIESGSPTANLIRIAMEDSEKIRRILRKCRTIAVVGLSAQWHRPSYFAAKYMQEHGYRVIPV